MWNDHYFCFKCYMQKKCVRNLLMALQNCTYSTLPQTDEYICICICVHTCGITQIRVKVSSWFIKQHTDQFLICFVSILIHAPTHTLNLPKTCVQIYAQTHTDKHTHTSITSEICLQSPHKLNIVQTHWVCLWDYFCVDCLGFFPLFIYFCFVFYATCIFVPQIIMSY